MSAKNNAHSNGNVPPIRGRDVIHRWEGNPVISLEKLPFTCLNIMNAGAVQCGDEYILLVRVETMRGHSVFLVARSQDGIHFECDDKVLMEPAKDGQFAIYEERGVEDPRITFLDGTYYIIYTANSRHGTRLALAKTDDFKSVTRIGLISEPDNKNGALFPKKINGCYVRLERPKDGGNIWLSYSDDLVYWGENNVVMSPRGAGFWDAERIGCAVPPIEVNEGWLLIFYGVKDTSGGPLFRLGAAVLDKYDPSKVIARSQEPILSPREDYERIGDVGNMVFSCGAIMNETNKTLYLYYGASGMVVCLGTAKIDDILRCCFQKGGKS
ncbi:MAG: glycoside hydrolase family 130 protein [Candidatus Omnitrophica bacterium]|nr:glycoside hydrolase family 130 protein [Candidatus Omnitrophota bacterium]